MLVMPYIPGHAIETKSDQIESNQIKSNLSSGVIFAIIFYNAELSENYAQDLCCAIHLQMKKCREGKLEKLE